MRKLLIVLAFLLCHLSFIHSAYAQDQPPIQLDVQIGDTWEALAWRFDLEKEALLSVNSAVNPHLNPTIGAQIGLPVYDTQRGGTAVFLQGQNLVQTAVSHQIDLHTLANANQITNPYQPIFGTIFVPSPDQTPRILPAGFSQLDLSHIPARPGEAVGWRGQTTAVSTPQSWLNGRAITVAQNGSAVVGLTGTGAFFGSGTPLLEIQTDSGYWAQPWRFVDTTAWTFQQLTLTGSAAEIDQAAIDEERAWLFELWEQASPLPQWDAPFQTPISSYLEISSAFGARRSYNGGPYRTYHEGVDFSAFGGTAVTAPASGTIIVAEFLYVRGGAVIIDHGLGIYSGFYHLSSLAVSAGDVVQAGALVGEVGTTGLSTGNHLHWDLLVNGIWVDALAWQSRDMATWILEGWQG